MKDLMKMMKQVQDLQGNMQRMQAELAEMQFEGQSGAGMVKVVLNGKGEMKGVRIDPGLMKPGEAEMVEDLVVAAFTDARTKVDAGLQEKMQQLTGGLPLPPGMKLF